MTLAEGRILACDGPSYSVCDGASEHASEGFFDVDDTPPWDTWLLCHPMHVAAKEDSKLVLFSWVPTRLVTLVDEAIRANPVDCIQWATSLDSTFTRELKKSGLLF